MFSNYIPDEPLATLLSQAAIEDANIDPYQGSIDVFLFAPEYIPQKMLNDVSNDISKCYCQHQRVNNRLAFSSTNIVFPVYIEEQKSYNNKGSKCNT